MSSTGLSVEDLKAFLYGMGFEPGDVEGMKETDLRELVVSLSAEQTETRMDTAGHRNRFDVRGSSDDVQFVPPTTSTSDAHNNESSHDATLQSFCEMTAMDVEAAGHLLEACGWDVNTALSMHMEQQEEARPVPSQATSFAQRPPDPRPDLPRAQNMHDAHFMQNVMGSMYQAEGGAHMRFRDEEDEEGTTGRSTLPLYDEFGIRRPDPVRVSRLLSQPGVNNDFSRADEPSVEWLFPPPRHLSFPGTFQEARTMAKQEKKWILVNIQSHEEFGSHQLNRDTWVDETVQEILRENFVFWQRGHTSQDARNYMSLYHITAADLPHIGIIDPRTGSKTSTIKGYMEPRILTQTLFEYFDENSFEANKAPKVRTHSAPSSSSSYSQQPIVLDDSDDEKAEVVAVPSKKMESIDAKMMKGGDEVGLASETKSAPSVDYGPVSEEPSDGEDVVRVSIKPAVGKPLVRRYRKSDLVRLLFAVAKQSVPEAAQGRSFALFTSFPKADLSEHLDQSIGDAGLGGAQVIMQWV